MKRSDNTEKEMKVRNVYLSDLNTILSIYLDNNLLASKENFKLPGDPLPIKQDFGLPLAIAEYNGTIIGYSTVYFDPSGKMSLKNLYIKENIAGNVTSLLDEHAEQILQSIHDEHLHHKIKFSIEKITRWLSLQFIP